LGQGYIFERIDGFTTEKKVFESISCLLPVTSKLSFIESYGKPSRAPTLIWLPYCAIWACGKAGI
jgi:hypothetical protein